MSDSSSMFRSHPFKGSNGSLLKLQQGDGLPVSLGPMARPMAVKPAASHTLYSQYPSADDDGIDSELWYACAGPHKTLPPVNSEVAYLPQGHIEQVASFNNQDVDGQIPRYNLPAVIRCTLNDIQLSADPDTDEVFATLTLCPLSDSVDDSLESVEPLVRPKRKSNSFTKTLTVSDTSTHGGFSVPRRAAEECLPPLDKNQDPPTQELVATDLHGVEWKFRHIFRGQPKRHLLTTGWSVFVSQKRLQSGDAVLFLRGENGQLRIGVRRAPKQQQLQSKVLTSPTMTIGVLAAAAHAATEKSRFSLIYNPRSCPSEFVIPLRKYLSAVKNSFSVGQRFKMRIDSEDSTDRRYTGTITGISDYDPTRWPGSAWRSLQVEWDESPSGERQERLSPWEIGPFTGCTTLPPHVGTRKRARLPNQSYNADHTIGVSRDAMESPQTQSMRLARVLSTGHDNRGMASPLLDEADADGAVSSKMSWGIKREDGFKSDGRRSGGDSWLNMRGPDPIPTNEMFRSLPGAAGLKDMMGPERRQQEQLPFCVQQFSEPKDSGVDLGTSLHLSPLPSPFHSFVKAQPFSDADLQLSVSSPAVREQAGTKSSNLLWPPVSSIPPQQQQPSPIPSFPEPCGGVWLSSFRTQSEVSSAVTSKPDSTVLSMSSLPPLDSGSSSLPATPKSNFWENRVQPEADHSRTVAPLQGEQKCKIFGVPLDKPATSVISTQTPGTKVVSSFDDAANPRSNRCVEKLGTTLSSGNAPPPVIGGPELEKSGQRCKGAQNWPQGPVRSYTKVHKQGAIGRSIDITKFDGYGELIQEVEGMFGLEGELFNKKSGWQLVYTDHEEDVLLVGDDPWVEFCSCVRSIRVLSPGETSPAGRSSTTHLTDAEKSSQTEGAARKDSSMRCDFQDNSSTSLSTL